MAENWQAGDLARCVDVRDLRLPLRRKPAIGGRFLRRGMVYLVREVETDRFSEVMIDVGARYGFKLARRFVKVPPLGPEEAAAGQREEVPA